MTAISYVGSLAIRLRRNVRTGWLLAEMHPIFGGISLGYRNAGRNRSLCGEMAVAL